MRAFAPRTLYRFIQTTSDGALRSLRTGNRLISDVSIPDRVAFSLGLTPTDIERNFDASRILFERQEEMRTAVRRFGAAFLDAQDEGDFDTLRNIARESASMGIMDSVIRSAQARRANRDTDLIDRQTSDMQALATKRILGFRR